jgi:L-asparaginase
MKKRIALISTGGTIEKSYDEMKGVLQNKVSNLDVMLGTLELHGVDIVRVPLMNKDSLDMTPEDHLLIAQTVGSMAATHDGVLVVHGTDRLAVTGEKIVDLLGTPRVPVVLTGAMEPYIMRNSDAMQNVTEALLAVQIAPPGVYVAMHNRLLRFPGVVKDPRRGTFVRKDELGRA